MTLTAAQVVAPQYGPGNNFPARIEKLKVATSTLLGNVGIAIGPNKLNRLCVTYVEQVEPKGIAFEEFLANRLALDEAQRMRVAIDPALARVISWADPTGETAAHNVDRERGGRR